MKKKLMLFCLFILSIFGLASCYLPLEEGDTTYTYGHDLDYVFDESLIEKYELKMQEANTLVEQAEDFDAFYDLFVDISGYAHDIATYAYIEFIRYSMTGNTDNQDLYNYFSSVVGDVVEWQLDLYNKVYESEFKSMFFVGMTDEQIQKYLNKKYEEEYYTIENEAEELVSQYYNFTDEEVITNTPSLYVDLVKKYNQMATIAGYSNYLEYAYVEEYGRDYSVSDVTVFSNYVKQYIVPKFYELYNGLDAKAENLSTTETIRLTTMLNGKYSLNKSYFTKYAKKIGGSYYTNYISAFDNGYYYISNAEGAMDGAYTAYLYNLNTPAMYFGPNYQDIFTVIHEYGHYFSATQKGSLGSNYDLAETQSQGNEMLFLAYLMQEEKETFGNALNIIKDYQMVSALSTIIYACMVNEFETYVYQNIDSLQPEGLDEIYISICNEYGGYEEFKNVFKNDPTDYWKKVVVKNAGYYISYAMSSIPALNIYQIGSTNLNQAIDIYLNVCRYKGDDYVNYLSTVGLYNPFEEECFIKLNEIL